MKKSRKISTPTYLKPRIIFYPHLESEHIKHNDELIIIHEKIEDKKNKTFSELLANIFRESIKCINQTEEFCKNKKIRSFKSIFPDEAILNKIKFSDKLKFLGNEYLLIFEAKEPIQKLYITLFELLREIYKLYSEIICENEYLYRPPNNNFKESQEEIIYQTILNEESIKNDFFRNEFLKLILLLQTPCDHLKRMINPIPGVPSDPTLRSRRAKLGGEAANNGKNEIIELVITFLSENRPSESKYFSSRSKLYESHEEKFQELIINHKEKNQKSKYVKEIKIENLPELFSKWCNSSEELKNEISFHVKK